MKKKNSHQPDQYFQQLLEGFKATPTDNVWKGLEEKLLERKTANYHQKEKSSKRSIFLLLGLLLLVSFGMMIVMFQPSELLETGQITQTNKPKNAFENEVLTSDEKPDVVPEIINTKAENQAFQKQRKHINSKPKIDFKRASVSVSSPAKPLGKSNLLVGKKQLSGVEQNGVFVEKQTRNDREVTTVFDPIPTISTVELQSDSTIQKLKITYDIPQKSFWSKITIAPWFALEKPLRTLEENTEEFQNPLQTKQFFEDRENIAGGWSGGLKIAYDLTKNWRIETGLSLTNFSMESDYPFKTIFSTNAPSEAFIFTSFNTNEIQFYLDSDNGTATGLEEGDLVAIDGGFKQKIKCLSVPISATYSTYFKRFRLSLNAGMSANFVIDSNLETMGKSTTILLDYKHTFTEDSGKTFLNYHAGLTVAYPFAPKLSVFTGAQFQRALTPMNKQKPVKFYPQSWSWQLGLEKRF